MTASVQRGPGYAPVHEGELFYAASGSGPAVVLLHAGIADLRMWEAQVSALAERYTVVCYDARGFGQTRSAPVAFANHQDLIALLDQLGIGRAALVGCSRGSMIALDTAITHPERVAALGWVCGVIGGFALPEAALDPREQALFAAMEAAETAEDYERVADLDVRIWVDGPLQPAGRAAAAVRSAVRAMTLGNYQRHAQLFAAGLAPQRLEPPALARLSALTLPVLGFVGALDAAEHAAAAAVLAARLADCRLLHYPDTAHLPNMEQPTRFNHDLRAFLDALPAW